MTQNAAQTSGLQSLSSPSSDWPLVVFSTHYPDALVESFRETGIPFKEVVGSYKGEQERAFVAKQEDFPLFRHWLAGQESILVLGPMRGDDGRPRGDRRATLVFLNKAGYPTSQIQELGRFGQECKAAALREDAWTYDPVTESYFTCR